MPRPTSPEKPICVVRHVEHVPLGSLEAVMRRAGVPFEHLDLFVNVPPRIPLERYSGLVVLGGPMSANDVECHPYLIPELDWIREAVDCRMPLLGICLGAQLLAKALGRPVYRNTVKEIGWYELELLPAAADDLLLAGSQPRETVFQWHGDTFDLPPQAVLLARSRQCAHQAFRVGPAAWGLQFHVEMTPPLMESWLNEANFSRELAQLPYIDPAAIRRAAPQQFPVMDVFSQRVLQRFVGLCAGAGDDPPAVS